MQHSLFIGEQMGGEGGGEENEGAPGRRKTG